MDTSFARTWLRLEGVKTESLRQRLESLATHTELAATGNLLIVTLPTSAAFESAEQIALDRWIRAGNTLLVMAALSDNPDWSFAVGGAAPGTLSAGSSCRSSPPGWTCCATSCRRTPARRGCGR